MNIYTSYFYQVRFFTPEIIPFSTAKWDPKWFHQNKNPSYVFKDKNGVYNGLRAEPFAPGPLCDGLCRGPETCHSGNPAQCEFLRAYKNQLDDLDFNDIMRRFNRITNLIIQAENIPKPPSIVLLVYETPDNPCSERKVIQDWFLSHGIEVAEWQYRVVF